MKIKNSTILVASAALLCSPLGSLDAFAVNPYGIEYSGGELLSSNNVQIKPQITNELTSLIKFSEENTVKHYGPGWLSGYSMNGNDTSTCKSLKYLAFDSSVAFTDGNEPYFTISNQQYTAKIIIKNIVTEDIDNSLGDGEKTTLFFKPSNNHLDVGYSVYSDSTCENIVDGTKTIKQNGESKIFVETDIKLYDNNTEGTFASDQLFFGVIDIDLMQSYKILNQDSLLTHASMYATSEESLQPLEGDSKNMYVANGSYIYSRLATGTDDLTNIYAKISPTTQAEGLKVVFGFAKPAGSNIEYYAKQLTVKYTSDDYGEITGITDEQVISGRNPSGSTEQADSGYKLTHWIVDKNVELTDGTTIKAGGPLSSDQVKQVIVKGALVFTAIHDKNDGTPAIPNAGFPTSEANGVLTPAFVATILPCAVVVACSLFLRIRKTSSK